MQVDRQKVQKLLQASQESMFRVYMNLGVPQSLLDKIFLEQSRSGIDDLIAWARQAQITDRQKSLMLDLVNWGLSTTGLMAEFGFQIDKEEDPAQNN